jgi:hypothetical protein
MSRFCWRDPCCSSLKLFVLSYYVFYVLSSVLWSPLRFTHSIDVRFVFTGNCCRGTHVLRYFCLFGYSGFDTYCVVFFFVFLRLVYAMLPVSLYCHFWLPLRWSITFICPVSCIRYVASLSVLSFLIAPSVFSNVYLSCVLCTLCCQSLCIVIFDCPFVLCTLCCQSLWIVFFDCPFDVL